MRIFDRSRVEARCGPTTMYHIVSAILPWVLFLVTVITLAVSWGRIPEQIPMQVDVNGSVSSWSGKESLIGLGVIYLIFNLVFMIIGYFPSTWSKGMRLGTFAFKRDDSPRTYRLTRDMLCDLRNSLSILFTLVMLWAAFGDVRYFGTVLVVAVPVLILVPMTRYLVRLFLFR